jgi:XTP/dITP diphosphohydrolase
VGVTPDAAAGSPDSPESAAGTSLGDRLLALVVEARASGRDAEQELREAVRRLALAVRAAETA